MNDISFSDQRTTLMDILSNPAKFSAALLELETVIAIQKTSRQEALDMIELIAPAQEIPELRAQAEKAVADAKLVLEDAQKRADEVIESAARYANNIVDEANEKADLIRSKAKEAEVELAAQKQETENNLLDSRRVLELHTTTEALLDAQRVQYEETNKTLEQEIKDYSARKQDLETKSQLYLQSLRE